MSRQQQQQQQQQKAGRNVEMPDECWELVFDRLGRHYRFEVVSLVSKHLFSVCSRLKRTLTIYHPSIRTHCNLSNFFLRFNKLSRIDFKCFMTENESRDIFADISRSGLDLEELNIWNWIGIHVLRELGSKVNNLRAFRCEFSILTYRDLVDIAGLLPGLEEFDIGLGGSDVTDEGIKVLVSKAVQLQRINLLKYQLVTDESLMELSSNCKFLTELAVGGFDDSCPLTENGIGFALRHCKKLASLIIHGIKVNNPVPLVPSTLLSFENSISYAKALCELELRYMALSDDFLCSIANARIPLKKLALWYCKNFNYFGLSFLLQECQSINHLRLGNVSFLTDSMMRDLAMFLGSVAHLEIRSCSLLSDPTFFILTAKCPFLVEFKLESLSLGQAGNFGLGHTENHNVRCLELRDNLCLNDESLKRFGLVCPNLLLLNLRGCSNITEKGIGEILISCSKLTHLEVDVCKGRRILGTGSRVSKLNLEVLQVSDTTIDDKGMALIGKRCRGLLQLELKFCMEVTIKGVKEVLANCVNLREINLYSCHKVPSDIVPWMISTRPSLRKIFPPGGLVSQREQRNLISRHGCVVCNY